MKMKIFPEREYNFQYRFKRERAVEYLTVNTKHSGSLVSGITPKSFIGKVDNQGFRLISSTPGIGAFCVLTGTFHTDSCKVNAQVNKPFKILAGIITLMMFATIIMQLITKPGWKNMGLVIPLCMFFFGGSWYLKWTFKRSLHLSINKLNEILIFQQ